jgi:C-terminal processing protease CtpA/Prc
MRNAGILWVMGGLMVLLNQGIALGDEAPNSNSNFKEVYDLIREHSGGITPEELDKAATKGLLWALKPKVTLVTNSASQKANANMPPVVRSNLFDGDIAYVRIGRVSDDLAKGVRASCDELKGTNGLKGVVLDLRYAAGDDYSAAAATADLFVRKEQPLLNWGNGVVRSHAKNDAISVPVAVLINHDTKAAAEALAAAVRQTGTGLLLGSKTAGEAMVAREYPLKNGDRLRIATARIEVGDSAVMSPDGVKPDIDVDVPGEDEQLYYADAFRALPRPELSVNTSLSLTNQNAGTNNRAAARRRFNEAELVRERKEGASFDLDSIDRGNEPDKPTVHDPALARALDLLKGLAVVRRSGG